METGKSVPATGAAVGTLDGKALAAVKANHDLHVLLLMRQAGISKSKATVLAYHEGEAGLNTRLAK